jgi:hypothetical protein
VVSPEAVSNRVSVRLSGTNVRIHAPGFGFTVKIYICRAKTNVILKGLERGADQKVRKTHISRLSPNFRLPQGGTSQHLQPAMP